MRAARKNAMRKKKCSTNFQFYSLQTQQVGLNKSLFIIKTQKKKKKHTSNFFFMFVIIDNSCFPLTFLIRVKLYLTKPLLRRNLDESRLIWN